MYITALMKRSRTVTPRAWLMMPDIVVMLDTLLEMSANTSVTICDAVLDDVILLSMLKEELNPKTNSFLNLLNSLRAAEAADESSPDTKFIALQR